MLLLQLTPSHSHYTKVLSFTLEVFTKLECYLLLHSRTLHYSQYSRYTDIFKYKKNLHLAEGIQQLNRTLSRPSSGPLHSSALILSSFLSFNKFTVCWPQHLLVEALLQHAVYGIQHHAFKLLMHQVSPSWGHNL